MIQVLSSQIRQRHENSEKFACVVNPSQDLFRYCDVSILLSWIFVLISIPLSCYFPHFFVKMKIEREEEKAVVITMMIIMISE